MTFLVILNIDYVKREVVFLVILRDDSDDLDGWEIDLECEEVI